MIFESTDLAAKFIENNKKVSTWITAARENARTLNALVNGDGFIEELIVNIEFIESTKKAKARKKYARDLTAFYERILAPICNVYSATGGSKTYDLTGSKLKDLLTKLANVQGGKSIQNWNQSFWMPVYHTDPNGIIFMEYTTVPEDNVWPTYKSIYSIRTYISDGRQLGMVLFEPFDIKVQGQVKKIWRLVDDEHDWLFMDSNTVPQFIDEETGITDDSGRLYKSFDHPFGVTPGYINSDIIKIGTHLRQSPIQKLVELGKEYARDLSIKIIYKAQKGFPIHWRYVSYCKTCAGVGKTGKPLTACKACGGKGKLQKGDVTDMVELTIPTGDQKQLAPDIAGFISPDLKTWVQYNDELERHELEAERTHWGVTTEKVDGETATGKFIDQQPKMQRLDKYAKPAEETEAWETEMIINFQDPNKKKSDKVAMISYGRRYILEGPDAVLDKYEEAKDKGDSNTILDRLFKEYLNVKYMHDPKWLRVNIIKSEVEPYIHYGVEIVERVFGLEAAQRKILFQQWWSELPQEKVTSTEAKKLMKEFDTWFKENKPKEEPLAE